MKPRLLDGRELRRGVCNFEVTKCDLKFGLG
jgi:hypothetical protein